MVMAKMMFSIGVRHNNWFIFLYFIGKKYEQQPVWPDWAKFRRFGRILKAVGYFETVYLVFVKCLNLLWQI